VEAQLLTQLLAMAAVVNRLVEYIRAGFITSLNLDAETERRVMLLVSALIGIAAAWGAQANILVGAGAYMSVAPIVGIVFTGILLGGGANGLSHLWDLLYGWKLNTTSSTISVNQTSTTTTPGGSTNTTSVSSSTTVPTDPTKLVTPIPVVPIPVVPVVPPVVVSTDEDSFSSS
jgi:hypothetical protein